MADLRRIASPVANLLDIPNGRLERQLLSGEGFVVSNETDGWAKGTRSSDGYAGYIQMKHLAGWADPTVRVRDMGAHVYERPDIKTIPSHHFPFQAELTVVDEAGDFAELAGGGFVHQGQIESIAIVESDFVRTAERYLGVPYLWGGNSQYGIDCSGLVSAAMRSAKIAHPADSGAQEKSLGVIIPEHGGLQRGDLIFWKGHVGLMWDETRLLHANGYHMKVAFEPLSDAIDRILATGGGNVTARRRVAYLDI
ncbi:hypothetical protein GCM10008927_10160 [Amylibacter ulvae]|uniref:NlpC/P60 domain-containing protein n=1 Tax=Paramylibacter ulvae TaxID=1651968 RepID=A0ABQ3CWI1_9RHOB|nr:NlpC/P60 family protein [Amylibacter ulvae]GHA47312.1 hypothetical protein GCM10008927_10160 [Amylibacter ulvae]